MVHAPRAAAPAEGLFLPWAHASEAEARALLREADPAARRAALRALLGADEAYPEDAGGLPGAASKREAFLDMAAQAVDFGRLHGFDEEKLSTLLGVAVRTHRFAVADPQPTAAQVADRLEELVLRHGVHRPPFSVGVFSFPEVKLVVAFGLTTYVRHLRLYQFVFGNTVHLDLRVRHAEVEQPDAEELALGQSLDEAGAAEQPEGEPAAGEAAAEAAAEAEPEAEAAPEAAPEADVKPQEAAAPPASVEELEREFERRLAEQKAEFETRLAALESAA